MNHPDTTPHTPPDLFDRIARHVGHDVVAVTYGDQVNASIECETCGEVIIDADHPDTTPQVIRTGSTRCEWATVVEIDGGPSGQWCEITWSDDPFDMPTTIHPDERHGRGALAAAVALALSMADRVRVVPNLELAGVAP